MCAADEIYMFACVAVEVLPLKSDVAMLNHAIDRGVYRIFGCSTAEDTNYIRVAVE